MERDPSDFLQTASSELAADGEEEPKPANGAVNGSVEETSVCPSIRAGIMPEVPIVSCPKKREPYLGDDGR
jgi:hypothetical protein